MCAAHWFLKGSLDTSLGNYCVFSKQPALEFESQVKYSIETLLKNIKWIESKTWTQWQGLLVCFQTFYLTKLVKQLVERQSSACKKDAGERTASASGAALLLIYGNFWCWFSQLWSETHPCALSYCCFLKLLRIINKCDIFFQHKQIKIKPCCGGDKLKVTGKFHKL